MNYCVVFDDDDEDRANYCVVCCYLILVMRFNCCYLLIVCAICARINTSGVVRVLDGTCAACATAQLERQWFSLCGAKIKVVASRRQRLSNWYNRLCGLTWKFLETCNSTAL